MTLRKRLSMLSGVWKHKMPYRDPHTVGPALWALRHRDGSEFEVSVAALDISTPERKGLECLAISLYRQATGGSPTLNFGRMPLGYLRSSANNRRLVAAGKRFRGGPTSQTNTSHEPGVSPVGPFSHDPSHARWCSHQWSQWCIVNKSNSVLTINTRGVYRIRDRSNQALLYLGEGLVLSRLRSHLRKIDVPNHKQGVILKRARCLEIGFVEYPDHNKHHLLEYENDLIASHLQQVGTIPSAQFLG